MDLPTFKTTVKLSKNYLTLTYNDGENTHKLKINVEDGTLDLMALDMKVGTLFQELMQQELDRTKLKRMLLGK